jgi:hypothetical protein
MQTLVFQIYTKCRPNHSHERWEKSVHGLMFTEERYRYLMLAFHDTQLCRVSGC